MHTHPGGPTRCVCRTPLLREVDPAERSLQPRAATAGAGRADLPDRPGRYWCGSRCAKIGAKHLLLTGAKHLLLTGLVTDVRAYDAASQFNQHEQETLISNAYSPPTEPEGIVTPLLERFDSRKAN